MHLCPKQDTVSLYVTNYVGVAGRIIVTGRNQMTRFIHKRPVALLALLVLLIGLFPVQTGHAATVTAIVAGSFQSEIGCPGDWQPDCDNSLMSDPDGDGTYTFTVPAGALPVGDYEYKVALNRSWNESYPADNQKFRIAALDNSVTFYYNSDTHAVSDTVTGTQPPAVGDNNIFWDGLGHDSQDTLYRVPTGAVPANTHVTIRFRTFHNDVSSVTLRAYYTATSSEKLVDMKPVAKDVSCYDPTLKFTCDFWQTTIDAGSIGTVYYRFIARDGSKTVYYEDDSDVRDGGWGKPYDVSPDWGWDITVYEPSFNQPVKWMKNAVIYQIFPDRFRNGDKHNDPTPLISNPRLSSDPRYAYPNGDPGGASTAAWDQIVLMQWSELPEGYCRNYQDAPCPTRSFFAEPPSTREQARSRDYYGGDLKGITQKLGYLQDLGVTVIYLNPIFSAGSNHRYDTRDYHIIDPYLGDLGDFQSLVKHAHEMGMKIILDGVFNHMSSDSPIFDRYHNWGKVSYPGLAGKYDGACEDVNSPYRSWFHFRPPHAGEPAACAPYTRDGDSYYDSWAGFDSLPQLQETPDVKSYIYNSENSVARYWLKQGADGWRLDVMGDKSIPFWEGFRKQVKSADPNAVIVGELWQKFNVLPFINGNTADTTMNYRLRDAVIGLLAPGSYDPKGFPGSGQPISVTAFVNRLDSIREDYPDATYYTLMNLLDSHDTARLRWVLTPGKDNRQDKEFNAANVAEGKQRQVLAALIQMTLPGAPTIYYGDEVGLTGNDDPDDRRTYPWKNELCNPQQCGPNSTYDTTPPDNQLLGYYRALTHLRESDPALTSGDLRFLLADDSTSTVAYGRKEGNKAIVVAINASKQPQSLIIPVSGYLPDGTTLQVAGQETEYTVQNGAVKLDLAPLDGILLETENADLTPTAAPTNLSAQANALQVNLSWNPVAGAQGYNLYRSPVSGGGYVKVNAEPITDTTYTDNSADLNSGQRYYYVVKALDSAGNESAPSNEASAVPSYRIDWANLQYPSTLDYTVSAKNTTDTVYGQVYIEGVTSQPGPTPGLIAQLGYGPQDSDPRAWNTWIDMKFNVDSGNNDEYMGTLQPTDAGMYSYFTRYSTDGGTTWTYGDLDGIGDGSFAQQTNAPGTLTVHPNPDQMPPAAPANLQAFNNGATSISLTWNASSSPDVYRYDLYRSTTSGSGYQKVASVDAGTTSYVDSGLSTDTTYYYVVRAVDEANNQSNPSNEASATPQLRQIQVTFNVTVPSSTPSDADVYIVGNQPELCNWCSPQTVKMTKTAANVWSITIGMQEGTAVEYKYTLGSWDYVEKDNSCGEVANRQLRVSGTSGGTQSQGDTVANWRNVSPCGN